jgi:DNA-binding Lrp family transcriptional regulator
VPRSASAEREPRVPASTPPPGATRKPEVAERVNGDRDGLRVRSDLAPFELAVIDLLQEDGRRSYRQMARELSSTEKHVRSTVLRLERSAIMEITAVTFPPLLGYRGMASVGIRCSADRPIRDVAADLAHIDAVDYVALTGGGYDALVNVVCRDRLELLACLDDHIRPVPGVESVEVFVYLGFHYQAVRGARALVAPSGQIREAVSLSDTDRDIIARLSADGRTPYQTIADQLGISEGQVRQRTRRLLEVGALRIIAIVNPSTLGYGTMAWIGIQSGPAPVAEVTQFMADLVSSTYVTTTAGRFDFLVELVCISEEELSEELDRIRTSGLVTHVESFIYLDLHYKRLNLT